LRRPEGLVIIGLSAGQPVREFHLTASPGQASVAVRFPDNAEMFSVHTGGQPAGVKEVNGTSSPDAVSPSTSFVQNLGTPWETIGGTYAKTTGGYQLFTFVHGASTTVGVGESASGAFGSFSADGTGTMTSGSTTTFPLQWDYQGSNHWYVEVTESESLTKCYQSLTGQTFSSYYSVSDNIYGGAKIEKLGTIDAPYCAPYAANTTLTLNKTSAATFGAGVTISLIGFNASAQTGYTSTASATFHLIAARDLCGEFAGPAELNPGPGQVQVQSS